MPHKHQAANLYLMVSSAQAKATQSRQEPAHFNSRSVIHLLPHYKPPCPLRSRRTSQEVSKAKKVSLSSTVTRPPDSAPLERIGLGERFNQDHWPRKYGDMKSTYLASDKGMALASEWSFVLEELRSCCTQAEDI
ncbi:uncharacterized protein K452DRAFT_97129 [Aplosporella prunicola CBS 121167]|uniref:Uncharacterized protein n=1 Tax=Aplosporella prunicola CBS 121167 TaxID=1176127 RepID=A0A6A6B4N6_9PEZI|nr:uncharacterized protein K452DRAFT_97129 [Aplosporella prunicola CBS 121167]KAF2137927.1 hypothetical protein K452DRAFT_97129 [Aplosporella prunicola CBS 121167]